MTAWRSVEYGAVAEAEAVCQRGCAASGAARAACWGMALAWAMRGCSCPVVPHVGKFAVDRPCGVLPSAKRRKEGPQASRACLA